MRIRADWGETYPALFLKAENDEGLDDWDREALSKYGIDVPDELAARWRATRDAWYAMSDEIQKYLDDRGIKT